VPLKIVSDIFSYFEVYIFASLCEAFIYADVWNAYDFYVVSLEESSSLDVILFSGD